MGQNGLGRALVLAEVARRIAPTEVVGVQRRPELWAPAAGSPVPLRSYRFFGVHQLGGATRFLRSQLDGSAVIVSKPRLTSLYLAQRAGVPLAAMVLDIDDWELGLMLPGQGLSPPIAPDVTPPWRVRLRGLDKGINAPAVLLRMEALARRVPNRLVSNGWLQCRFGGALLPHLRDTEALAPDPIARAAQRAALGLGERVWASFVGTARSHKGLEELIEAVAAGPDRLGLMLCGLDERDEDGRRAAAKARQALGAVRVRVVPPFASSELRRVLSAADISVVPSRETASSVGQIPAKLFDGLSMGLPVVATDAGTIAEVVGDAGLVVKAGDVAALSAALRALCDDPARRTALGKAARVRAIQRYDLSVGVPILRDALRRSWAAHRLQERSQLGADAVR